MLSAALAAENQQKNSRTKKFLDINFSHAIGVFFNIKTEKKYVFFLFKKAQFSQIYSGCCCRHFLSAPEYGFEKHLQQRV